MIKICGITFEDNHLLKLVVLVGLFVVALFLSIVLVVLSMLSPITKTNGTNETEVPFANETLPVSSTGTGVEGENDSVIFINVSVVNESIVVPFVNDLSNVSVPVGNESVNASVGSELIEVPILVADGERFVFVEPGGDLGSVAGVVTGDGENINNTLEAEVGNVSGAEVVRAYPVEVDEGRELVRFTLESERDVCEAGFVGLVSELDCACDKFHWSCGQCSFECWCDVEGET